MRAIEADIALVLQRVRVGDETQDATTYLSGAGFECHDITDVRDPDPERVGRLVVCRKPYKKLLSLFPQELAIEITTSENGVSITKLRHYQFKYQA